MFDQIYMFFGPKRGFLTLFGSFSGPKKVGIFMNIFQSFSSENNFQKGVFVPLWPIFGQNRSRWPTIIPSVILEPYDFQRRVTCLCSNNILKNGKNEVFWGFKRFWGPATGQKKYFFFRNWKKTIGDILLRNPETQNLSRYNQSSCWNPRAKPPVDELFWGFLRFWGPAAGQKKYFLREIQKTSGDTLLRKPETQNC